MNFILLFLRRNGTDLWPLRTFALAGRVSSLRKWDDSYGYSEDPSNPERLTLAGVIRFYDLLRVDVETAGILLNGNR